ncbi:MULTISPECIES: porin [unclassified Burkholderia]|uniref:porin n=1 Tax=unclassified Burkholderia TaxID=2613784 RepID=UPI000F5786D1|nr:MULTISPECIES: porin [unclassified Burkholderia]RQR76531.1 porin [Burkholderia sp. Bp9011]RQR87285.1 porin [Burkholderia sp. Bp9010]RQS69694.1 porin [Burkholderia sp. Bp8977]
MKIKITLLAMTLAIMSAHVMAQSSVTLYGVIDEGLNYATNVGGKKFVGLESGYTQGSQWGVRGVEDIGGGTSVVFQLENGFDVNTGQLGQAGLEFGRQAFFGLSDKRFGTLTIGRQYDTFFFFVAPTTANGNWAGFAFTHPYDNDDTEGSTRVNNTIQYTSPSYGGFQVGGTYGFSNSTNFANNRQYSIAGRYTSDNLTVAVGYEEQNQPGSSSSGAVSNGSDDTFRANRVRRFGAGVNYTTGPVTLGLAYTYTNALRPINSTYAGSLLPSSGTSVSSIAFNNIEVNAKYQVSPAWFLGGEYVFTRANYHASGPSQHLNYHTIGLMSDYFLSKRTDLYAQAVYQRAGGDTTGSVMDNAYVIGSGGPSSSNNQMLVRLGIRHRF